MGGALITKPLKNMNSGIWNVYIKVLMPSSGWLKPKTCPITTRMIANPLSLSIYCTRVIIYLNFRNLKMLVLHPT